MNSISPPNPSSAAREAANETLANIMRKHIEDAARAEALAARLQSALSASAARVKELEDKLSEAVKWIEHAPEDTWGYGSTEDARWPLRDELVSKLRRALSIKAGETK